LALRIHRSSSRLHLAIRLRMPVEVALHRLAAMKRWIALGLTSAVVLAAVVVAGAVLVLRPGTEQSVRSSAAPAALETAELPVATAVIPPPEPVFSRAIFAATDMATSDPALDQCRGPVAIDLGASYPLLVAEHDYCGGSAWIPRLEAGDTVRLSGEGVRPGLYEVSEVGHGQRRQARYSDLPDAEIVLQTCISQSQIVLVGLEPAEPTLTS
jgi:hypothetical protein